MDAPANLAPLDKVTWQLGMEPRLAHSFLFAHRHPQATPSFHWDIIDLWHSDVLRMVLQTFRGGAKSTLAEEAIVIAACFRRFKNIIVLGETWERAVERLTSVKHEIEHNLLIEQLFGHLVGDVWTQDRIVLANGTAVQAFGRGQSLRGSKHLDWRPDLAFADDVENEESASSDEAIEKTMRWLMSVVVPALDPGALIRVNGTPLHPRSMIVQLARDPAWVARVYPIEHVDPASGRTVPSWPERFSAAWVAEKRKQFHALGLAHNFQQEFMCQAEDPAQKVFLAEHIRIRPQLRTWQAVYAMYDPARTVKATSAVTGVAVWSWIANKLVVWDAYGEFWRPDQIIADVFRVDTEYHPIAIGVERDGLEEFIMQPLRHEQVRRAYTVPIRPLKAPKGKLDFIRALSPFFRAGEVELAHPMPDLVAQLLSFPAGRIDIPNALAYALVLRPGQVMYDGFSVQNIAEDLAVLDRRPLHLAIDATTGCTAATLVQMHDGTLRVLADWVREGDPGASLAGILMEAGVAAGGHVVLVAGPQHFATHDTVGLRAAARQVPVAVTRGGAPHAGREELRALLRRQVRGQPALRVATAARWTLNALAGGYARDVGRDGLLSEDAVAGPYRTLMEGLESFAALVRAPSLSPDQAVSWRTTPDGRRYISSLPGPGAPAVTKATWHEG